MTAMRAFGMRDLSMLNDASKSSDRTLAGLRTALADTQHAIAKLDQQVHARLHTLNQLKQQWRSLVSLVRSSPRQSALRHV